MDQIIPHPMEKKASVSLMANIHVALLEAGAVIQWNTVKQFSTEISAEQVCRHHSKTHLVLCPFTIDFFQFNQGIDSRDMNS